MENCVRVQLRWYLMKKLKLDWQFPLSRTHCGILLGNGLFGAMVWGDEKLCITINRADFWDHRNHLPVTEEFSYAKLRRIWEAGDEEAMDNLLKTDRYVKVHGAEPGVIESPSGLPMGRIELGIKPQKASLDMRHGILNLTIAGLDEPVGLFMAMNQPVLLIEMKDNAVDIAKKPAWEFLGKYFQSIGYEPPRMIDEPDLAGWIQMRPADPYMCLACERITGGLAVTSVYGNTEAEAKEKAVSLIGQVKQQGLAGIKRETRRWWRKYWDKIPRVNLPSPEDEEIYYYGMFKFAGMANGYAAPLVGPWAEEYRMPDCSNDYHFNINVQMNYWPAYAGNCLEFLLPLFAKIKEWEPIMRRNARCLFGVDDGLYLTMSVSDIGEHKGGFWPCLIDFASTGWIAHLMWLYYRYSLDTDFLRETCYPFMKGIMRVYESVLEEENGQMVLPMSTAPEYNEYTLKTGGRNPSFQLACIHFLLESLISSSELLGVDQEKALQWRELKKKVLPYVTIEQSVQPYSDYSFKPQPRRIAIFEGQDLEWSHRHHSHLAALHPFDTIDRDDQDFSRVLGPTINHWINRGVGGWIHFSFVWAAIIHARLGNGEAAYLFLELFKRLFMNEGRNSMAQANTAGLTLWTGGNSINAVAEKDGDTGAVNAIQEMLIHTVRGVLHVFPAVPKAWQKEVSFENMRSEGAFLVSASMKDGRIKQLEIFSERGAPLRLNNNIADEVMVIRDGGKEEKLTMNLLATETRQGETIVIKPAHC